MVSMMCNFFFWHRVRLVAAAVASGIYPKSLAYVFHAGTNSDRYSSASYPNTDF
jgi:hypothetical protein